jgi:hypothetical protein
LQSVIYHNSEFIYRRLFENYDYEEVLIDLISKSDEMKTEEIPGSREHILDEVNEFLNYHSQNDNIIYILLFIAGKMSAYLFKANYYGRIGIGCLWWSYIYIFGLL